MMSLALLAGCGSAPFAASDAQSPSGARAGGPAGGSPALARAAGQRMLGRLMLPHGARRIGWQAQPTRPEVIGTPNLVDVRRFFSVPTSAGKTIAFLQAHHPAGARNSGDGTVSTGHTGLEHFVSYQPAPPPAGISDQSQLLVSVVPARHGGAVVRADAEMVWFTPRTAAEYLRPSRYREVLVRLALKGSRPVTRTITSRGAIGALTRLFNRMQTAIPGPHSCPAFEPGTFRLGFVATPGRPARVVVTSSFCMGDLVIVRGKAQPQLFDPESTKALALISSLLGLRPRQH